MTIPIIPIIATILGVALLWWVVVTWITDAMILKVAQTIIVVFAVLWLIGILTGRGPEISFR